MNILNTKKTSPSGQKGSNPPSIDSEPVLENPECLGILWRTDSKSDIKALITKHIVVRDDLFFWSGRDAIVVFGIPRDFEDAVSLLLAYYFDEIKEWSTGYIETDCSDFGKQIILKLAGFGIGFSIKEDVEGSEKLTEHVSEVADFLTAEVSLYKKNFDSANHRNALSAKSKWLEKIKYI